MPQIGPLEGMPEWHGLAVDFQMRAGRRLLPGVGHDDPHRAEVCAQGHHAGREEMHFGTHLVPPE